MEDKKKIEQITEANSPVRLIEPDQAWAAMQQKLDAEWPAQTPSSPGFTWLRIWGGLGVVVLIAVVAVLWKKSEQSTVGSKSVVDSRESIVEKQSIVDSQKSIAGSRESGAEKQSIGDSHESIVESQSRADRSTGGLHDTHAGTTSGETEIRGDKAASNKLNTGNGRRTNDSKGTGKVTDNNKLTGAGNTTNGNSSNAGKDRHAGKTNGSGKITDSDKTTSADKIIGAGKLIGADQIAGSGKTGGTGKDAGTGSGKANGTGKPANAPNDALNNSRSPLNHRPAQQQVDDDLQASTHFVLQPATQAINVAGHVAPLPIDSANTNAPSPGDKKIKNKRSWQFMAGLQWAAVSPAKDNKYYTTGSNGSNQVYRHLLPAVVLTVQKNRHRAGINLYPFLQAQFPDTAYSFKLDTNGLVADRKSLVKMFGYGAGINYAYNIYGNWWLGAGVQGNWWKKGLVHYRYHRITTGTRDTLLVTGKNDTLWKNFAGVQFKADLELWYDRRQWALGLQGSMPLVKPLKVPGATTRQPISVALLLRWKLYRR